MTRKHRIVISTENTAYLGWQTKLFYFSCVSRLQHQPLIIVHDSGQEDASDFYDIIKAGGIVHLAPSYKLTASGDTYPPRNTAGTLLNAAEMCDGQDEFIVLCDPDMIFVRRPTFPQELSGEYYSYLNYDRPEVTAAGQRLNIPSRIVQANENGLRCGVPYVIPVANAKLLARTWLEAIDAFPPRQWMDVMHAFGLAAAKLQMKVNLTNMVSWNGDSENLLTGDVIHYCYGDDVWNKRDYLTEEQAQRVWEPTIEATEGSVLREVIVQLEEARTFYRNLY